MKRTRWKPAAALLLLALAMPGWAEEAPPSDLDALRAEVEALKKSQEAMQKDLKEILALLRSRQSPGARPQAPAAAPAEATLDVSGVPSKGSPEAQLVILEFSDYQCPFCARSNRELLPAIDREYLQTGRARYYFRDYPLPIHANAQKAAEAAWCAGEQGKFWPMHDRLFAEQKNLAAEALPGHAEAVGLDAVAFAGCLESGRFAGQIRRSVADADTAGVRATPTFLLGRPSADGQKVRVVRQLRGAQPWDRFKAAVDELLAQPPAAPAP